MSSANENSVLTLERRGHVLLMGLNRPQKRNAFKPWSTPVNATAQGWCMTLGIELLPAAGMRIAGSNATRWLLTGDEYDATEAHRIGLIQEITKPGEHLDRAVQLAESIATRSAPVGVRTTLTSAQQALRDGHAAAAATSTTTWSRYYTGRRRGHDVVHRAPSRQLHRPLATPLRPVGAAEPPLP